MAIADGTAGAWTATTTRNPTVTLPSHSAGDMLLVRVGWKSSTPTTDVAVCNTAGWAKIGQFYDGGGVSSNGGGGVLVAVFWKVATSGAETNPVIEFDDATAPTPGCYSAVTYTKASTEAWVTPAGDGGAFASATSYSATIQSHVSAASGDMIDAFAVGNDNNTMTVPTFTQTGLTLDTVTEYPATALSSATSNDIEADGRNRLATAGTSSAAAVVTGTLNIADSGSAWTTRLRVVQAITLGLLTSTSALYAPTVTPKNAISLGLIDAAKALYAPTLAAKNTLTLGLIDSGRALYAPTLTPKNAITLGLLDSGPATYAPTLAAAGGAQAITLGLLDSGPALHAPALTPKNTVTLGLLDSSPALYAPTLIQDQFIALGLLDAAPALYAPTLTPKNLLALGLLDSSPALYAPTLAAKNTITLGLLDAAKALYAPSVSQGGVTQAITLGLLDSGPATYAPTLVAKNLVTLPLLDSGPDTYAPNISRTLALELLDGGRSVYAPMLASQYTIVLPSLDSMRALYAPTVVGGSITFTSGPGPTGAAGATKPSGQAVGSGPIGAAGVSRPS